MLFNVEYVAGEVSGTGLQDTFKTSMCTLRLFPTAEGPADSHPTPLGKLWVAHVAMVMKERFPLTLSRTRSRRPCALSNCSRQLIVLERVNGYLSCDILKSQAEPAITSGIDFDGSLNFGSDGFAQKIRGQYFYF